jgi:hypothetical protein
LVASTIASLQFLRAEALQVFAECFANQRRAVHAEPFSGAIRRSKKLLTEHNLNSPHTIEFKLNNQLRRRP